MATGDDRDTQATDAGIASDETVPHDPSQPTPQPGHVSTGRVIRASRASLGPERLGRYEIVKRLGRGGMGAVFEANDPELGRRVAIKVLRDDREHPGFTESLRREAQALAKLVHPNVVTVYDVGVDDGRLFVVMQLVEGESIDRWLHARHAKPAEIVAAFREAGKGLAAAHAKQLVHCDFKPSNVLVDADGAVRVGDFGLARFGADSASSIAGTPAYMPPEQFTGTATAASDQYAFCASLWEVLAGAQPFAESKIGEVEAARTRVLPAMPRAARVPAYVVRALSRGLANDPAARFPSMEPLLAALAPPRRGWIIACAAAVALAGGAVAAVLALRGTPPADPVKPGPRGIPDLVAAHALTQYGMTACAYAPTIDRDHVVFDRTQGDAVDLYEMPITGGTPRQLTSAPTWEWRSNPGRHPGEVVHLIHDPQSIADVQIAYLDLATGKESTAAKVGATDAVVTTRGVIYVTPNGRELRRNDGTSDVAFAPAPKGLWFTQIAVSHHADKVAAAGFLPKSSQMCIYDVATAVPTCFKAETPPARAAFGADDRYLYYVLPNGIHRRELATGDDALIIPNAIPQGGITISQDGSLLIYSDCGTHTQVIDLTAKSTKPLIDDQRAYLPVTANGVLAWSRVHDHESYVVARDAKGHEYQVTESDFGAVRELSINPRGDMVAFRSDAPHRGIFVASIAANPVIHQISDDPNDEDPLWAGNEQVVFTRKADRNLETMYIAHHDGGMLRRLPGGGRRAIGATDKRVLYATTDSMYWLDLATGKDAPGPKLPSEALDAVTSPGARWLLLRRGAEGQQFMRMRLDPPGPVEEIGGVQGGQTAESGSIADDGRVLTAPETWTGDLYVIPAKPGAPY